MSHHHSHHSRHLPRDRRRLALTLVMVVGYMLAEVIGGWLANSLALLADAGHMLSDAAALGLSFFAVWIADRPSPPRHTYGYYRAEILAALVNGATLVAVSVYIIVAAIQRLREPAPIAGGLMLGIAVGGLAVNVVCLAILHGGRHHSLNLRGAWLHVLSDALGSVGAIVAGGLVWSFGWYWADPVASLLIALLIVHASWRLLVESVSVLMEHAPEGIDVDQVLCALRESPGVSGVHDLHIWSITSGLESLSAHVVVDGDVSHTEVLASLRTMLHKRFGIDHVTIQIEPPGFEERPIAI